MTNSLALYMGMRQSETVVTDGVRSPSQVLALRLSSEDREAISGRFHLSQLEAIVQSICVLGCTCYNRLGPPVPVSLRAWVHCEDAEQRGGPEQRGSPEQRPGYVHGCAHRANWRIGSAITQWLAKDGAHVVISSRKQQNVDRAVARLQGAGLSMTVTVSHVGKAEARQWLVAEGRDLGHCGGVDFLVCNAAVNPWWGTLWEPMNRCGTRPWMFQWVLSLYWTYPGFFLLTLRPLTPCGSILNVHPEGLNNPSIVSGSIAVAQRKGSWVFPVSAKQPLLGPTWTLTLELAPKNIWMSCLVPSIIKTNFSKLFWSEKIHDVSAVWTNQLSSSHGMYFQIAFIHNHLLSSLGSQGMQVPLMNEVDYFCYSKAIVSVNVAVVTGSTKGIGFAIARRLAQDGAHVVISSRKQQNVDQAVAMLKEEGLSVTGTVCHVGKAEDRQHLVATALEHSGGVDFLVCVAGVNPLVGSTLGASEQIWDKILDVNVKAPALLLSQLLPHMEKRSRPCVVLVSSGVAYLPVPGGMKLGVYNTSKTALLGLCKSLAVELAPKGVRVNCIVPGIIKTDFSRVEKTLPNLMSDLNKIYKLQRLGEPEDCAGIVSFLCSKDASYITGENIVVAGFSPRL
ncbi:dehydrogenase/reductase SDR family member 2, mitochondrial-like [Sigmodon hispidus]